MNFPKPIITHEHGSWAVLFVPMVVGISFAGTITLNNLLLALSALGACMGSVPIHTILRQKHSASQGKYKLQASVFWSVIYVSFGSVCILPLLLQGFHHLIIFAVIGASSFIGNYLLSANGQKSIGGDLIAVAGLTLSAPSAYYVSSGLLDMSAAILWLLNFLFFGCSVFYVHMKIKGTALKSDHLPLFKRLTIGWLNIVYHIGVIGIVIALAWFQYTPITVMLAFVPMVVHALYGTIKLNSRVKFKKLGFLLLAQSILFGIILVSAWS